MANSVIQFCPNCPPNEFQDTRYGFKMRVMNPTGKLEKSGKARCTCCGVEADIRNKERVVVKTKSNESSKGKKQ